MRKNVATFLRAMRWTGVLWLLLPSALAASPASAATTTIWTILRNGRGQIVLSAPAISISASQAPATIIGGQPSAGSKLTFYEISVEYRVTTTTQNKLSAFSSTINSRLASLTVKFMRGTACLMKTVYSPITPQKTSFSSIQVAGRSQPAETITFAYGKSRLLNPC